MTFKDETEAEECLLKHGIWVSSDWTVYWPEKSYPPESEVFKATEYLIDEWDYDLEIIKNEKNNLRN